MSVKKCSVISVISDHSVGPSPVQHGAVGPVVHLTGQEQSVAPQAAAHRSLQSLLEDGSVRAQAEAASCMCVFVCVGPGQRGQRSHLLPARQQQLCVALQSFLRALGAEAAAACEQVVSSEHWTLLFLSSWTFAEVDQRACV